jgi:hypothetical protein
MGKKTDWNSRPALQRGARSLRRVFGKCLPYRLRQNLGQWLGRALHEPDFELFDALRDVPGVFLDVGANRGPAAIPIPHDRCRSR